MKRIIRIELQDRIRQLAFVVITTLIGSPLIVLGNGLANDKDSNSILNKFKFATDFGFSIENSYNEPYLIVKGSFEPKTEIVFVNETDALSTNRNTDEPSTVTFFVFNQNGLVVPDALIELSNGSLGMTDEFGIASFLLLNDSYTSNIMKSQHETLTVEFIVADEDLFLEILLIELPQGPIEITCPPHLSSPAIGICFANDIDLGEPIILDSSPSHIVTNNAPLSGFAVGTTIVTWTVVNEFGETASCDQFVTVFDVEPPVLTPLPNITIDNEAGDCGAGTSWDIPTASDNCEVETIVGSHAPGDFFPAGSTSVVYTATDVHGNAAYAGFTVAVIDVEPPIISPLSDITIDNEAGECGGSASWDPPTTSDNCEEGTLEGSHAPGDFFSVGSTSVIYTATDVHGNAAYSGFKVDVIDVEPPVITPLPDINIDNEAGECGGSASWDPPTTSDNCEGGTLEGSHAPGDFFPAGSTSVIYTATDVHGNAAYAGFTVEVIDVEPPTIITLPEIIVQLDPSGNAAIEASDVDNGSNDECGIAELAVSPSTFSCADVGSNTVILTGTDINGNTNFSTATVTVIESPICLDCEGVVNGDAVPGSICFNGTNTGTYNADCECIGNDFGSLNGHVDGLADCGLRNITISTYNDEFPELNNVFSTTIDENGDFTTPAFSTGTYSVLIKIDGYLAKLYADEIIDSGINPLLISGLINGDINNSNNVNVGDVSALNASFGSIDGDSGYNEFADLNCDGLINVVDVSILNSAFGMVGDNPPPVN